MIEFVNFLAFRKYIITTSFFHTFHPRSRFLVNTDHICQQLKTKTILKGFKTHQSLINKQKHIKYMNQRTSKNTVTLTSNLLQIKKIIQNGNFIRYAYLFHFLTSMFTIYWFSVTTYHILYLQWLVHCWFRACCHFCVCSGLPIKRGLSFENDIL